MRRRAFRCARAAIWPSSVCDRRARGADRVIDLSGSYHALREAVRIVGPGGTVVAAGLYQGPASALALGEEFHHNRVTLIASQIGGVPPACIPVAGPRAAAGDGRGTVRRRAGSTRCR